MVDDMEERPWWVFKMPACTVYVPANTEAEARAAMVRDHYKDAPVASYPLIGTRFTSRHALSVALLRKAA